MCLIMLFVVLSFESCLKPCWLETFSTRDYVLPPCQHPRQIIPLPFWCQISWNPLKRSLRVCVHKKEKKNTQTDLSDTLMATTSSLSYIHPSLALTSVQSSHSKSRPCLLLALIFLLKKKKHCFLIPLWKGSSLLLFCIAWASAKTTERIPASLTQIQIPEGSEATKK